jgi:hypothetical protein
VARSDEGAERAGQGGDPETPHAIARAAATTVMVAA